MGSTDEPAHGRRVTIADVASVAGVSLKSVSRVLNNEPHVSPKLRAKIEAAIAETNYSPDIAARSLAGARTFSIGLLLHDLPSAHDYTLKVQTGVYRACAEHHYHLRIDRIDPTELTSPLEAQLAMVLRQSRSDGLVLIPPIGDNPAMLEYLERAGVRYSRVGPVLEPDRSPSALIDDSAAAGEVAQMFWRIGHRRFGLVNGPQNHGAAQQRREGFLAAVQALGAPEDAIVEACGDFTFEGGMSAGRELLQARPLPTAIFAANDDSAAGVMAACSQAGVSIPGDLSVCGFDDSWIANCVWPYLTTVHQPVEEMAYAAAVMLISPSSDPSTNVRMLPFRLVERASVGPPSDRARSAPEGKRRSS